MGSAAQAVGFDGRKEGGEGGSSVEGREVLMSLMDDDTFIAEDDAPEEWLSQFFEMESEKQKTRRSWRSRVAGSVGREKIRGDYLNG